MFKKRLLSLLLLVGCWAAGTAEIAKAAIVAEKDSSMFEHFYEGGDPTISGGDVSLDVANSGYDGKLNDATLSSDGDILTNDSSDTGGVTDAHFQTNLLWNAEADRAGGWTWETRFRIDAANLLDNNLQMRIGSSESTADLILFFGKDFIRNVGGGSNIISNYDLTDSFHTLRIGQEGGTDLSEFWVDGVHVGSATGTFAGDEHWFGGGAGATIGGISYFDYIRWTGLGGFAPVPVPEPAVASMLFLAGAAVMLRRQYRCQVI